MNTSSRTASWDRNRYQSVMLEHLRYNAADIRTRAENVGRYVRSLGSIPPYTARAEEAIEQAELALTEVLLAVKLARSAYAKLPKSDQPLPVAAE